MKYKLKFFGMGLFIAGILLTLNEQFDLIDSSANSGIKNENKNEINSLNETIDQLENEVKSLTAQLEEAQKENVKTDSSKGAENNTYTEDSSSNKSSNETVHSGTIYVYESISLYDIGRQAEDLQIVANGRELELYLAKPEYARFIQIGTFELNSSMTLEQMAKILTGKK